MNNRLFDNSIDAVTPGTLWADGYKIPWNDPAFSARILREHLSQDHALASRRRNVIAAQATWIRRLLPPSGASVLDLGCGPGLYAAPLASGDHRYHGIDFGPASIEHARACHAGRQRYSFRLGDVTEVEYGGPYGLAMMLYGELNVFPPDRCRDILARVRAVLQPGGLLLVELQDPDAVRGIGQGAASWTRAERGGLFADEPYVCLTENRWFALEQVALQCFHVLTREGTAATYRSTTRAWTREEMAALLREAGYAEPAFHDDWPVPDGGMLLVSARRT